MARHRNGNGLWEPVKTLKCLNTDPGSKPKVETWAGSRITMKGLGPSIVFLLPIGNLIAIIIV